MTPTSADFRHIAVEALIDAVITHLSKWPPQGWCDAFDAAHSYIPAWACHQPHVAFVHHCRDSSGPNSAARHHALSHSLRVWLRSNDCDELARRERDVREAHRDRDEDPQTWAPYQRVFDEVSADVPY